jgi:hypothetical protein
MRDYDRIPIGVILLWFVFFLSVIAVATCDEGQGRNVEGVENHE